MMENSLIICQSNLDAMPNECRLLTEREILYLAKRTLERKFGNAGKCPKPYNDTKGKSKVLKIGVSHTRHGGKHYGTYRHY